MGVKNLVIAPVSCFGGNDGKITVAGTGGSGAYAYELSGPSPSKNTIGEFSGLKAGDYTLIIKNDSDCKDSYTHSTIKVVQPTTLLVKLSKQDISCNGLADGVITATVSGGTAGGGYTFTWETMIGTIWTPLSVTDATLTARGKGAYRLRVKDANGCSVISNEVGIVEPTVLIIEDVKLSDIKCIGDKAFINIAAKGGMLPYTFEYTKDNGLSWTVFTNTTPLGPGSYKISVKDKNNCTFLYSQPQIVTEPSSALSFTAVLSDYGGSNISCWGGANGHATLTAKGGNGGGYSAYEYSLDDGPFQTENKLEGIIAGNHTLSVKDGRGCISSQVINFSQTSEKLMAALVQKQDVSCFGEETGILEITGTGGRPPYQYSMDGINFLSDGRFVNLSNGIYQIMLKDANGCTNTYINAIATLYPPMEIAYTVKHVSCFGGNDGQISLMVSSGIAPFQYQWFGSSATSEEIQNLIAGTYIVKVTDSKNCSREVSVDVAQPAEPLAISFSTQPVCVGQTNGAVTLAASGGTAPYQYAIDGGQLYQDDPYFPAAAGKYLAQVKDVKGCVVTATATVEQRNDMPEPDFLVATKRNALDTLVITDISVPKPDSIAWLFDPGAKILNTDQWSPQLSFAAAGSYALTMTGYFDGCAYAVTKTLTLNPYDPDVKAEKLPGYRPIESLSVSPNPSSGAFKVSVKLNKKYNLSLVIYDVMGVQHYTKSWENVDHVAADISLDKSGKGIYLIRAITESDAKDAKIIIEK